MGTIGVYSVGTIDIYFLFNNGVDLCGNHCSMGTNGVDHLCEPMRKIVE